MDSNKRSLVHACARWRFPMIFSGMVLLGTATLDHAAAQQQTDPFRQNNSTQPPASLFGFPTAPTQQPATQQPATQQPATQGAVNQRGVAPPNASRMQDPPNAAGMRLPQGGNPAGLAPPPRDPTQTAPDMRRILEGEQEQVRREPPPPIEVVGKVIGRRGTAKALLRINSRYYLVEKGTRFSLPTSLEPVVYTVSGIDDKGIEIQGGEENLTQRLQ